MFNFFNSYIKYNILPRCRYLKCVMSSALLQQLSFSRVSCSSNEYFFSWRKLTPTYSFSSENHLTPILTVISMTSRSANRLENIRRTVDRAFYRFFYVFFSRIFFSRIFPELLTEISSSFLFFFFIALRSFTRTEWRRRRFSIFLPTFPTTFAVSPGRAIAVDVERYYYSIFFVIWISERDP